MSTIITELQWFTNEQINLSTFPHKSSICEILALQISGISTTSNLRDSFLLLSLFNKCLVVQIPSNLHAHFPDKSGLRLEAKKIYMTSLWDGTTIQVHQSLLCPLSFRTTVLHVLSLISLVTGPPGSWCSHLHTLLTQPYFSFYLTLWVSYDLPVASIQSLLNTSASL